MSAPGRAGAGPGCGDPAELVGPKRSVSCCSAGSAAASSPPNARAATLTVAPTQAGKTTRLVVPNVLGWRGPLVVTSVKADVLAATDRQRRDRGHVQVFDPIM